VHIGAAHAANDGPLCLSLDKSPDTRWTPSKLAVGWGPRLVRVRVRACVCFTLFLCARAPRSLSLERYSSDRAGGPLSATSLDCQGGGGQVRPGGVGNDIAVTPLPLACVQYPCLCVALRVCVWKRMRVLFVADVAHMHPA
jgi:hypothetical protein